MAQIQYQALVSGPNGTSPVPGGPQFMLTSLYVGDLDVTVTDEHLFQMFSQVAQVASVRVCRDLATGRSLGYGYVNYNNPSDAARAMDELNYIHLNGKPIRIMYSQRDPTLRKSGTANIFIKNLDKSIDHKALHDTFSSFGNILSCKIATDDFGKSKGYGFVQFEKDESAQSAIEKLNGMLVNEKKVYVGPFLCKQERDGALTKLNNIYVKNLSESTTDEDLKTTFGEFGEITSVVVMRDADGKSKGFGFVNFENDDDGVKAIEALNGKKFDEKEWYVEKAIKKFDKERYEQTSNEDGDKFQGLNLYIKNLDDTIGDEAMKELFSEFGTITSCKVMRDHSGISKGSGFVAFSAPEEASRALVEMNGKMVVGKPLYVALAQKKEERRARLQAQFSQMRPLVISPVTPRMPMYPGAPGLGQPFLYGQAPPLIIPPLQVVPGMRPGVPPLPNLFVPVVHQGQQGQREAGSVQQAQQPVPFMQPNMMPRGHVYYHYAPGGIMPGVMMSNVTGGMISIPYGMVGMPSHDAGQPTPISAFATALANATPEHRRTMLGESLYPLVEHLERDLAAKVTGMLLEMDQTEVLKLLESQEALKAKVDEAVKALRSDVAEQNADSPANESASLSLDDNLVS